MGEVMDIPPNEVDAAPWNDFFLSLINKVANKLETLAKAKSDDIFLSLIDDAKTPVKVGKADDFFLSLMDNVARKLKTTAEVKDEVPQDDLFLNLVDYMAVQEASIKQRSSKTHSDLT